MLENLRLQIGSSYARYHFRTARDPIVRFTEAITDARRLIVFLPELSGEASVIKDVLEFLSQRFHTAKVLLVARNEILPYLPEHRGFDMLVYGPTELNKWFVPRTDLLRKMKKSTFDVALDLSVRFALASSFLCRASQAPLRIGFVKPFADSFYNFQIQTGTSSSLPHVYSPAAQITLDDEDRCCACVAAVGGATSVPVRLQVEMLIGFTLSDVAIGDAVRAATEKLDIMTSPHASDDYRRRAARVLAARALAEARDGALARTGQPAS